ncbi:MAG: DUF6049 family protein [Candidatus Nanopelagicales bacterium]
MRAIRRAVPVVLIWGALLPSFLLPIFLLSGAPAAVAADEPAEVLIESVAPGIPDEKATLRISGRVANTGDTDLAFPEVQLRLSPLPLNSRGEVTEVLNGSTDRTGNPIPFTLTPIGETLEVGQQAQFRLTVPFADLPLDPGGSGVYAVFVELLSGGFTVIQSGTVLPWFGSDADFTASELAWVWPIAQQPAIAADELVLDPSLPGEYAAGGRLGRLLTLGQDRPVSWLVDTSVLEAARSMADGYQVVGPDGPEPGDQTDSAAEFARRLQQLLTDAQVAESQFALADADALQRAGLEPFVVRSASLPAVVSGGAARASDAGVLFLAPGGNSDRATLQTLTDAGVRRALLGDQVFPPDPPTAFTPSGITSMTVGGTKLDVLLADRLLGRILNRPLATAAERSRARQEFLADTAMITLELPGESRSVVAVPPMLWDPPESWLTALVGTLDKAPWIQLVGLDSVAAAPAVPRIDLGYSDVARRKELPLDYTRRLGELDTELDRLSRIVIDPAGYGESFRLALQRAGSAVWRDEPAARNALLETIDRQLQEQKDKVRVVSAGTVTLAGDSGVVPLTIANDLDRPVSVGVQLATENPITLQYTPPDPVRIEAKEKVGLEVPVRVVGSQTMPVDVLLTDRDGELYDDSATIELRSTAATRIATVVVGVGGVALVILTGLNLVRRRRTRLRTNDPEPQRQDERV